MREKFDEQLDELNKQFILLGSVCEKNIAKDAEAIRNHDREEALAVFNQEYELNNRGRDIERLCLSLILRQQPVASDLRLVSGVLKMVTDLDRIGTQAGDIAEIIMKYDFSHKGEDQDLLLKMADECVKVLHSAIDAYVRLDQKTAEEVLRMDDSVDQYFAMVKEAIIQEVSRSEAPKISFDVILMAKYLERIGDHCCNIAQWVLYIITGKQPGTR